MNIDRVSVAFGYTHQPRQFESLRFDVRLEATVDEDEDWSEVVQELHAAAKAEVRREVSASMARATAAAGAGEPVGVAEMEDLRANAEPAP